MEKRALVLVTLRDRDTHWRVFKMYMAEYYPELTIAIIQQADNNKWNKGLLFNVGYSILAANYDYVLFHDIDFLPVLGKVDYSYCDKPTLLATECSQFNYQHCYDRFFGGVIGMNKEYYELVNGFSNKFRGWGGEDDLMYNSFIEKGVVPEKRLGNRFENFVHPRLDVLGKDKNNPDYQHNLKLCTSPRDFSEGLSNCMEHIDISDLTYHKIQGHHTVKNNYTHIKVVTK